MLEECENADIWGFDMSNGDDARDDAMDRAARDPPRGWEPGGLADRVISIAAERKREITSDDIWPLIEEQIEAGNMEPPRTNAALGPLLKRAQKNGIIQPTMMPVKSKDEVRHSRRITVWRTTDDHWNTERAIEMRNIRSFPIDELGGVSQTGRDMDDAIETKQTKIDAMRASLAEEQRQLEEDIENRRQYPKRKRRVKGGTIQSLERSLVRIKFADLSPEAQGVAVRDYIDGYAEGTGYEVDELPSFSEVIDILKIDKSEDRYDSEGNLTVSEGIPLVAASLAAEVASENRGTIFGDLANSPAAEEALFMAARGFDVDWVGGSVVGPETTIATYNLWEYFDPDSGQRYPPMPPKPIITDLRGMNLWDSEPIGSDAPPKIPLDDPQWVSKYVLDEERLKRKFGPGWKEFKSWNERQLFEDSEGKFPLQERAYYRRRRRDSHVWNPITQRWIQNTRRNNQSIVRQHLISRGRLPTNRVTTNLSVDGTPMYVRR